MAEVLNKQRHERILLDLASVCRTAGIQGKYLKESMTVYCDDTEVDWVRRFRQYEAEGKPGLALIGTKNTDARCQAIAAALVRNFVDARVVPMNTLIEQREEGLIPHVLLIPNLFVASTAKFFASWKIQGLYDTLLQRSAMNKPTVVYLESMNGLRETYGEPFAEFVAQFTQAK